MNHLHFPQELNFATFSRAVGKRKLLSFVIFSAVSAAGFTALMAVTPKYDATAMLIVGSETADHNLDQLHKSALTSLALIAESNEVISEAVRAVGLARLNGGANSDANSERPRISFKTLHSAVSAWFSTLPQRADLVASGRANEYGTLNASPPTAAAIEETSAKLNFQRAVTQIGKSLTVSVRPNSDLLSVTYRHRDPAVAAEFANAVAAAAINKRIDIVGQPAAATFYERQTAHFEAEVKRAAAEILKFSITNGTYSSAEQNTLLLKRASDLAASLASTRGSIADQTGKREALTYQLNRLKPVTQSQFVSTIVNDLGAVDGKSALNLTQPPKATEPPLLLVKVYQDAMVELMKVNSSLGGLNKLEKEQSDELARTNQELNNLASKEIEFSRLKRAVDQATLNAEGYQKRAVEEQISSALSAAKISNVKLAQPAIASEEPTSPKYGLSSLMILLAGLASSVGSSVFLEMRQASGRKAKSVAPLKTTETSPASRSDEAARWDHLETRPGV